MEIGVTALPHFPKDATDRNRTSPFAFTGNRFEFRAVGSSQSIAGPQVVINTIVAESLDHIATELENVSGPAQFNAAVQALITNIIREHGHVIFNGDNYSEAWHAEAARRGLPNAPSTPEALDAMDCEATFAVFERYGVLSRREAESRFEIYREKYVKDILIEARLCLSIARTMIFPAVVKYQQRLAQTAAALHALTGDGCTTTLREVTALAADFQTAIHKLDAATRVPESLSLRETTHYLLNAVIPLMAETRRIADGLEHICSDEIWPLPTYQEMLFIR